jgi:hypothetical protein
VRDKGEQREIERGERQSEEVGLGRDRSQGGENVRETWRNSKGREGTMRGYSRRGGTRREEKERCVDKKKEAKES